MSNWVGFLKPNLLIFKTFNDKLRFYDGIIQRALFRMKIKQKYYFNEYFAKFESLFCYLYSEYFYTPNKYIFKGRISRDWDALKVE